MAIKKNNFYSKDSLQAGVTLIEMLVVVGIIALISSVMMFNYSDFSTNVSVRNLSQEIALSVRKAQTYATSVRTIEGAARLTSDTFPGYGVSFSADTTNPEDNVTSWNRQFVLFADSEGAPAEDDPVPALLSSYDQSSSQKNCGSPSFKNECIESFAISTADKIDSICIDSELSTPAQNRNCSSDKRVDITFRRPSPDAIICQVKPSVNCKISYVTVNLLSAKGLARSVQIWNTGQIAVK